MSLHRPYLKALTKRAITKLAGPDRAQTIRGALVFAAVITFGTVDVSTDQLGHHTANDVCS